jgi:hypothetical protein
MSNAKQVSLPFPQFYCTTSLQQQQRLESAFDAVHTRKDFLSRRFMFLWPTFLFKSHERVN